MDNDFAMNERNVSTVSVAIASFNGEKYIKEQLASVMSQTRKPDEVIISDDNSTDATVAHCESFKKAAPFRVDIFINEKNVGVTRNFENALRKCRGDIVFLCDQDDVWFPNKIETIKDLFNSKSEVLAISNDAIICDENLTATKYTTIRQNLAIGRSESAVISGCCSAFRREFLEIALPIPQAAEAHDNWLNGLANLLSARVICGDALQYYRRHGNNESHDLSSRAERLSSLSLIKQYGLRDAKPGWRNSIAELQAYVDRIRSTEPRIRALELSVDPENVVDGILSKIDAIQNRLQIVDKPRWKRVFPILSNYINGSYFHFHGLKSAVKDIVRP